MLPEIFGHATLSPNIVEVLPIVTYDQWHVTLLPEIYGWSSTITDKLLRPY